MDAAPRGRRGRAEIHTLDRRPVGVPPRHRPEDRLAQRGRATVDVAAQQIGIVRLRLGRPCARNGPAPGRGSRGRSARSAPPCARSCPPTSRSARGSRPTACACPPGARVGSTTHGWATSTKGCSACRPAWTAASARATSSNVPPTWTVTVRRQASAPQGTGPSSAQSTLQVPAPGLNRAQGRPARRDSCVPASATNARGEVSRSTARAGGSSASDATGLSVCTTPPRRRSSLARPWVMAALPPATTGQPAPWPSAVRRRPKAEVSGAVSGSIECAAVPASRARAASVAEAARRVLHGRRPDEREAGERQRVTRHAAHGRQDVGHDAVQPVHQRAHQVLVGRGVTAEVGGRLADVPVQARPPARRRADGRRRPRAGAARRRGRPGRASGRTVRPPALDAPPSTRRDETPRASGPGSGSRPPIVGSPSKTSTPRPARANVSAAARPLGPEPTTTASARCTLRRYRAPPRAGVAAPPRGADSRWRAGRRVNRLRSWAGRAQETPCPVHRHEKGVPMAEVHGTCEPRFEPVRADAGRPARDGGGPRRLRRRLPARRAGRRHLGRLGRRGEDAALGARHHHERLVHHQDHDLPRRPHAARPQGARLPCARRHVLARVRRQRQGAGGGPARHGAHGGTERLGRAARPRGPGQLGALHHPAGRAGAVVGAGHRLGVPRV